MGCNKATIHQPEHWRSRAAQMRVLAVQATDAAAQETMLKIATDYDQLAKSAELRAVNDYSSG